MGTSPLVKWAGGKRDMAATILKIAAPTRRWIEPFAGGMAVALASEYRDVVCTDVCGEIIDLYRTAAYAPLRLHDELWAMMQRHPDCYYDVRASTPVLAVERAARTLYLNRTGFNGLYRVNRDGRFNVPLGRGRTMPTTRELLAFSRRVCGWRLRTCDFEETIALAREGDVVYCDPPYHGVFSYSTPFDQRARARMRDALEAAVDRGATAIVTDADHPTTRELYARWRVTSTTEARRVAADVSRRQGAACLLATLPARRV